MYNVRPVELVVLHWINYGNDISIGQYAGCKYRCRFHKNAKFLDASTRWVSLLSCSVG